jgi:hypothetical protein
MLTSRVALTYLEKDGVVVYTGDIKNSDTSSQRRYTTLRPTS